MPCQFIDIMGTEIGPIDFLVYPTTCYYYFYAWILFFLFGAIAYFIYNKERENFVQPDMISCLGVSAQAIFFLSTIMTLIKSTGGIPMLQRDIYLVVLALWIIITGIWYFKDD